ncbi:MAG: Ltp family lipoprotein [Clostridia bacterium]|nr:Ltp family lipoprotein [Clostridia bacterium]
MKKHDFKVFTAGMLATALTVGGTTIAFSETSRKSITAEYNNIKIYVDGKLVQTSSEPFVVNGTTYLPVRAVGEAVGKSVTWDGATQSVYLGVKPASNAANISNQSETTEQKNACAKAEDYLDFSAFSRSGLIEQLKYEGYSTEAATYAADKCGANWNEQAAKKAKSYLSFSSFSHDGLIEQLEYDGFTTEQAEYGVKAVGY